MQNSLIAWTDHTFNPIIGCTKVSPGCLHCYAEHDRFPAIQRAKGIELWGKGHPRHRTSEAYWQEPLRWNKKPLVCPVCNHAMSELDSTAYTGCPKGMHPGRRHSTRIFSGSLCDVFDDEDVRMPDRTIDKGGVRTFAHLLQLIHATPKLTWLLCTKRPQNWAPRLDQSIPLMVSGVDWATDWRYHDTPPHNVQLLTTVENQEATPRIRDLIKIPAVVHGLSVEPMLEEIYLGLDLFTCCGEERRKCEWPVNPRLGFIECPKCGSIPKQVRPVDWVIFGGESGSDARPCHVEWIRHGIRQCRAAGVAVFVKQLGSNCRCRNDNGFEGEATTEFPMGTALTHVEPKIYQGAPVQVLLNHKKGGDFAEWPEDLHIREYPFAL